MVSMVITRLEYGSATLAGLPDRQFDRLQSVLNASARLVCWEHWLPFPERVSFRLAALAYRCLHGLAPSYLSDELHRVADTASRQRLRSASTAAPHIPSTKHFTLGDRVFPHAASRRQFDIISVCLYATSQNSSF